MEKIIKAMEEDPEILFAYIFGSYAKGTQKESSDIDVAVYLRDESTLEREPLYPSRPAINIERALAEKRTIDVRVLNGSTLRFRSCPEISMISGNLSKRF